jgi:hypothetical protein
MLYFEKSGGVGDVVCALLEAKHSSQAAHTEAGPSMMAEQITHLPSEFIGLGMWTAWTKWTRCTN